MHETSTHNIQACISDSFYTQDMTIKADFEFDPNVMIRKPLALCGQITWGKSQSSLLHVHAALQCIINLIGLHEPWTKGIHSM